MDKKEKEPKPKVERDPRIKSGPIDYSNKDYKTEGLPKICVSFSPLLTRVLYYPENHFAKCLAYLMRRMTFTKLEIDHLRQMGFIVDVSVRVVEIPEDCR